MPSPICTANGLTTLDGYNTFLNKPVTIQLIDKAGVNSWSLTCVGTDDLLDPATVSITIDQTTCIATFTTTTNARGGAYIFQSQINGGLDTSGIQQISYTCTFGIYAIGQSGNRLIASNQTIEGDHLNGWIKDLNIGLFNVPLSNTTYGTEYGSQDVVMTNQFGPDGGFNIIGNMLSNTHIAGGITFPTQATYNGSTPTHQMIAGFYTVVWSNSFSATDSITLPSNPGNDGQLYMIINKSATYPLKIYGNFPSGVVALSINIYRCISLIYSYPLNMWFPLGAFT